MHCFVHVHRRRKPSAPGAFWTVLLMEQVAKATCILCKKLQRTRGGTWRFPRVSRAKSGILWLSGGTTRVRWCGASYQSPSMCCTCACAFKVSILLLSDSVSPVAVEAPVWRSRSVAPPALHGYQLFERDVKHDPNPAPPTPLLLARVHVQKGWREYTYTEGGGRPPRPRRAPTQHGTIPRPAAALPLRR